MICIRVFRLVDILGHEFKFNQERIITNPKGLGFTSNVTCLGIDNYYINMHSNFNVSSITFDIIFYKGYGDYTNFMKFVEDNANNQFRFYYRINNLEKYCYVNIKQISKGELSSKVLIVGVELERTSHWLIDVSKELVLDPYPLTYPITYYDTNQGKGKIINNGVSEVPLKILIKGIFTNPKLKLISSNGKINELEMNVSSSDENAVLIIDANPFEMEMALSVNNEKTNVYSLQNFNKTNFMYLNKGVNQIEYLSGSVLSSQCIISYVEEYLGV